uniref:SCD domain-containing protein n=1 Tax=Daucus carota subsp. sativus TaxID=79200 RepID=A0A164Z0G5_DAUCS
MEEPPVAPATASRRSKRPRVLVYGKSVVDGQSPEHENSFEDFEEPRPKGSKRTRVAGESSAPEPESYNTLIEVIKGNGKHIPRVVKLWVESYEKDPKPAMVELLTMLFEACGAKYRIQGEFLDETDVDDVVVDLVKLARDGEIEDYQNSKKKEFKNFKDNLVFFWDNLVAECQNGPLYDQVLFDKCINFIIALSCTPPRVYRQVASLMGLQLVTSFINVAKVLGAQRETTQRQLNAEMKKTSDGPRVESLKNRVTVTHENITMVEGMMRKIFTGLFVHRYRDIDPDIRMSCIQSLGVWIQSYQSLFLQDLYLKYLGWTLNDKSAGVRKASVLALQNLYEVDDNVPSLGLFTERFYKRMLELADDIDISVAVCAIGLVKQLLRHQLVPDEELGSLYDLLIDDPPDIRRAIGALVYDHLIAQKFNSSQSHSSGEEDDSSEVHLVRMLKILGEFQEDQILSIYVIDDVWEFMNAMKDWKRIISMLLSENSSTELTNEDITNLTWLLCASVKKSVGERIVPATDNRKQYYTKAQRETIEINRKNITVAMMKNYPQLLRKYMVDDAKVPLLVEIIVYMNLELYSLKRQEQNFKTVLQLIKDAFFKHGEKDVLRSCVKAIIFCSSESHGELQDFAQNKLKELEDELIAKLKSSIKEVADGDDEYSLLVNLKRLYELQLARAVPIDSVYDEIVNTLENFRNMDDEVVSFLLLNMHLHVSWSLHSIVNNKTIPEASVSSLMTKRTALFAQLEHYLPPLTGSQEESKCGHLLACRTNFNSTKLEHLGYCPDVSVLRGFWGLCEQQLNISEEAEEEDAKKEYVEETNRDAVMIAAAKLIATDAVPKEFLAPEIISHFVMHGTNVGEIVKHLISLLKKKDDDISYIFLEALKRAYRRTMVVMSSSDDVDDISAKLYKDCKDLSARLSGTFVGAGRSKHRADILKIVKDGIEFAFLDAPKHLAFLDFVVNFVSKLPRPDILEILKDVQKRTENVDTDVDPSGWRPYYTFKDSLQEKYAKNEDLQADDKPGASIKRRGRPRKKDNIHGKKLFDEQSSSEEEDPISVDDHNDEDEEDQQEEDEDEEAPLIHSLRASQKLKSLRVSREEKKGQTSAENLAASRTSGASS